MFNLMATCEDLTPSRSCPSWVFADFPHYRVGDFFASRTNQKESKNEKEQSVVRNNDGLFPNCYGLRCSNSDGRSIRKNMDPFTKRVGVEANSGSKGRWAETSTALTRQRETMCLRSAMPKGERPVPKKGATCFADFSRRPTRINPYCEFQRNHRPGNLFSLTSGEEEKVGRTGK